MSNTINSLIKRLQAFGLTEGATVYFWHWTPKKGYHYERMKFSYNHAAYGKNYPNLYRILKTGSKETISLMQNSGKFKFKEKIFNF